MSRARTESFGAALRRLRQAAGLTQEEAAERAGLSAKAISALERGERRRPYPHTVRALGAALQLDDAEQAALQRLASPDRAQGPTSIRGSALPVPATPLVGRQPEIDELLELLGRPDVRIVTVSGPGGVGKTRLVIEVAHRTQARSEDAVVLVPLAEVREQRMVLPAVARALELGPTGGTSLLAALSAHLSDRLVLLVVDNVEHVVGVGTDLAELIACCPGLRILSTSRIPLRIRGEHDYALAPLALPAAGTTVAPEQAQATAAVELFVERAHQAVNDFALSPANTPSVVALCRRVDGLPLALELAAAQLRYTDPATLLDRIDGVIDAVGPQDLPARQRTIRATIQWSHDLLNDREQVMFRRLGVFAAGWSLDAAEAVVPDAGIAATDVLPLLGRLVEHSLVVARSGDAIRYRMLEPVRQYAMERLAAANEEARTRERHARWFERFADRPGPGPVDAAAIARYDRLEGEHANITVAFTWLLDNDPGAAARLSWSLWGLWLARGHLMEGLDLAERGVRQAPDDGTRARAAAAAAHLAFVTGDAPRAIEFNDLALASAERASDQWILAHATTALSVLAVQKGKLDDARRHFEAALALARAAGDLGHVAAVKAYLANLLLQQGHRAAAEEQLQQAVELSHEIGHRPGAVLGLLQLGRLAIEDGDTGIARHHLTRGVAEAIDIRELSAIAVFAEALAVVAALDGNPERAARLQGIAQRLLREVTFNAYHFIVHDRARLTAALERAADALGTGSYDAAVESGAALTVEAAIAELLAEPD